MRRAPGGPGARGSPGGTGARRPSGGTHVRRRPLLSGRRAFGRHPRSAHRVTAHLCPSAFAAPCFSRAWLRLGAAGCPSKVGAGRAGSGGPRSDDGRSVSPWGAPLVAGPRADPLGRAAACDVAPVPPPFADRAPQPSPCPPSRAPCTPDADVEPGTHPCGLHPWGPERSPAHARGPAPTVSPLSPLSRRSRETERKGKGTVGDPRRGPGRSRFASWRRSAQRTRRPAHARGHVAPAAPIGSTVARAGSRRRLRGGRSEAGLGAVPIRPSARTGRPPCAANRLAPPSPRPYTPRGRSRGGRP